MKVLFDAYWWGSGPTANAGVQREIIEAWISNFPQDEIMLALRRGVDKGDIAVESCETHSKFLAMANLVELPKIASKWGADLVISHNFAVPPKSFKSCVFIHDLMFLSNPEWFTWQENLYFRLMPIMARSADTIFTSSRTEAQRIGAYLKRDVISLGLTYPSTFDKEQSKKPDLELHPKQFYLTVSRLNRRKNLSTLLDAALLSGSVTPDKPIVIVGEVSGKGQSYSKKVHEAVLRGSIIFLGKVASAQLIWLYQNAERLLFLSLNEGFGLPLVEAIRFGTPILASDIAVFREILGDNALFADPLDVKQIAQQINRANTPSPQASTLKSWNEIVLKMRQQICE